MDINTITARKTPGDTITRDNLTLTRVAPTQYGRRWEWQAEANGVLVKISTGGHGGDWYVGTYMKNVPEDVKRFAEALADDPCDVQVHHRTIESAIPNFYRKAAFTLALDVLADITKDPNYEPARRGYINA